MQSKSYSLEFFALNYDKHYFVQHGPSLRYKQASWNAELAATVWSIKTSDLFKQVHSIH